MPGSNRMLVFGAFISEVYLNALDKGMEPVYVAAFYLHVSGVAEDTGVFEPKIGILTMGVFPYKPISEGLKIYNYLVECKKILEFTSKEGVRYGYVPGIFKHNTIHHPHKPLLPFPPKEWWVQKHYDIIKRWELKYAKKQTHKPKDKLTETSGQNDGQKEPEKKETVNNDKEKVATKKDDAVTETIHKIVAFWNLTQLPHVTKLTTGRRDKLKVRLQEKEFVEGWKNAIIKMSESDLCLSSNWANFDFLVANSTNYIKVLEDKYINAKPFVLKINPKRKPMIADFQDMKDPRSQVKAYQEASEKWEKTYGDKKEENND